MKGNKEKGFSMVELIIVIAILAILIATIAPLYMRYVEKTRVAADIDLLDAVYKACTTAAMDDEINDGPTFNTTDASVNPDGQNADWSNKVLHILGVAAFSDVEGKLKSHVAIDTDKGNRGIHIDVDANGNYTVYVGAKTNANRNATGIVAGNGADGN